MNSVHFAPDPQFREGCRGAERAPDHCPCETCKSDLIAFWGPVVCIAARRILVGAVHTVKAHDTYPARSRVPGYREPCSGMLFVCQLEKAGNLNVGQLNPFEHSSSLGRWGGHDRSCWLSWRRQTPTLPRPRGIDGSVWPHETAILEKARCEGS